MARDKDDQYPNKSISSSKKDDKWTNPKGKEKDPHKPKQEPKPRVKEEENKSISKDNRYKDWAHEDPNKPKPKPKDDGEHPKGMGGSKVPSKPGPKKPMTPAAKRLKRTASRSK